uniref:Uncharacterized protein n=1 Tax=Avena sativa TaxID=4498 RepID=A0ACD5X9I3_AVESA
MQPPPLLQTYDPTRGLISCFTDHGLADENISAATADTLRGLLVDLYQEAFRRLPVEDLPDDVNLPDLIDRGGLCLGLLDPVTNIILNTVSLLPDGFETNLDPPGGSSRSRRRERRRDEWEAMAWRSSRCFLDFMRAYFGLLTEEQAGRYLVWARADLAVAVLLVEHELYAARPAPPDPCSGRTRNSLRLAATHANHPFPDLLVSLATAWLPRDHLEMLAPVLRRESGSNNRLTVHDVKTVLHVLRHQDDISATTLEDDAGPVVERTTTCADLGEGRIACTTVTILQRAGDHIASLRSPRDMDSALASYSTHAAPPPPGTVTTKPHPCDSPCASVRSLDADADTCPYVRSLEMSLYGTIHGFYLRALAMLPTQAARHHVRGIFLAGHCYGPMDPVSNIVLNAVWYDANFPPADRHTQAHDILAPFTILRAVSRSLRGLIALLHATSGQQMPLHEILKYLCYTQCDLSAMSQLHGRQLDGSSTNPSPLAAAATAAEHPQASAMSGFLTLLAPMKLDRLRSLMMSATDANNGPLTHNSLTQMYNVLRQETSPATTIPWRPPPPKLCNTALSILTRKREDYAQQQSFIRGRIQQLLQDYAVRHPSEPEYILDFVCGATTIVDHMHEPKYHVNFMAAATKSTFKNTLFFAEFGWAYQDDEQSNPPICCPLPQPYHMGRCYYGHESARSIVYPDHFIAGDITDGGLDDTQDELDIDFMYFDYNRDVQLAKVLQRMAKKENVTQKSYYYSGRHDQKVMCQVIITRERKNKIIFNRRYQIIKSSINGRARDLLQMSLFNLLTILDLNIK